MTRDTKINRDEGASTISRIVTRCYECEIVFQPENNERCCSDCSKGTRPFINHTVDHLYVKNMLSFSDEVMSESSVGTKQNQPQLAKRSISDSGSNRIKRIKLIPDDSWQLFKNENVGSNGKKFEETGKQMTVSGTKDILNVSSSKVNIRKQIHYVPISKNLSGQFEKTPKSHIQEVTNTSRVCAVKTDVSQQRMELVKWNRKITDSKDDTVISPISNFQLVSLNHKSGFSSLELIALRAEEKELEEMIISCSSESDEVLSLQKMRMISELESKRFVEKKLLASKKEQVKSLERQASQSKCFVDTSKEERDSLSDSVKESIAALELARSSVSAAEKDVTEAVKKLAAVTDEDFKNHLRYSLAMKDKRAAAATSEIVSAVSQLRKVEKDLQDAEEEFKTKKDTYQQALEQVEKAESDYSKSRDHLASIDQELTLYYSQLKSLNQDNYCKRFELKKKLLDIQRQIEKEELLRSVDIKYDRKREELDVEQKFVGRFLSLTQ